MSFRQMMSETVISLESACTLGRLLRCDTEESLSTIRHGQGPSPSSGAYRRLARSLSLLIFCRAKSTRRIHFSPLFRAKVGLVRYKALLSFCHVAHLRVWPARRNNPLKMSQPEQQWYFISVVNQERYGPYSAEQLEGFVRSGSITRETMIWTEALQDQWIPATNVEGLFPAEGDIAAQPTPTAPAGRPKLLTGTPAGSPRPLTQAAPLRAQPLQAQPLSHSGSTRRSTRPGSTGSIGGRRSASARSRSACRPATASRSRPYPLLHAWHRTAGGDCSTNSLPDSGTGHSGTHSSRRTISRAACNQGQLRDVDGTLWR
ncbi:MAG: hypothetical protein CMN06_06980 [Roseibacillus sp.]|nr:hypothetical protein [Roseibacillus sp.]